MKHIIIKTIILMYLTLALTGAIMLTYLITPILTFTGYQSFFIATLIMLTIVIKRN